MTLIVSFSMTPGPHSPNVEYPYKDGSPRLFSSKGFFDDKVKTKK